MAQRERVVVTGIGLVSPLAIGRDRHMQRLLAGESGVRYMQKPEFRHFSSHLEAVVGEYDPKDRIKQRMLRKLLTPSAAFAVIAAGEAVGDSGLDEAGVNASGIYVGSLSLDVKPNIFIPALKESLGADGDFDIERFAKRGTKLLDPLFLVKLLPNGGICGISIEHGIYGPNCNITNGTVSGLQAVIHAAAAIRRGEVDAAVAGGYDSLLHVESVIEYEIGGQLSKRDGDPQGACRPFDAGRDGFVLGEGAAFLMLESATHALRRGARIYGELLASGQNTDNAAFLKTGDQGGDGLARAVRQALAQAQCAPAELDVIYGDGLATEAHDNREIDAYHRLVNSHPVDFTAATGALGFGGATTGMFSLAHALAGIERGYVAPLINCTQPDARCDLPLVHQTRHRQHRRALVWNSDHGVKNVAILVGAHAE